MTCAEMNTAPSNETVTLISTSLLLPTISNLAVSAIAITAMTPAWTGSLTTRSAESERFRHVQRDHVNPLLPHVVHGARDFAPMSEPASTSSLTRGNRTTADRGGKFHLAHERDRISRIRSPRMLWRSASAIAPSATCRLGAAP